MAGISIPGVTDQYKTSETIEKLMQVERVPLTREQNQLEQYKAQKDAWREITTNLSSLRDSTKNLYSFDNPFNSKITSSSDENAVTAEANRGADIQSFKIDVIQPATADRFLSNELENNYKVPQGVYTYKVGEKQLTVNWKGGTLKEFSDAINKRGTGIVKSMVIGASAGKKTLLIESLTTGKENKLVFEKDAKTFAEQSGMITPIRSTSYEFGSTKSDISAAKKLLNSDTPKTRLPDPNYSNISVNDNTVSVSPRGAYQINIPQTVKSQTNLQLNFKIKPEQIDDITVKLNEIPPEPKIPDAGFAEFGGIVIQNSSSETLLQKTDIPLEPVQPVSSNNVVYALMSDGSEKLIETPEILFNEETNLSLNLSDYEGIQGLVIRNENTGYKFNISSVTATNPSEELGYSPNHPIATAGDAVIKYEGITITRPSNSIDDVIPEITLNIHDKTEKTATINVKPDLEASKNALIDFVGKYNQTVAKINILSQNKNEIIEELDYFTQDEKDAARKQLGMFSTDFSLTNIKSNMQTILVAGYQSSDNAELTMLSQLGIATNASGFQSSYSQARLRGYLEIDEKKLDAAIENHLDDIKNLFGYDSDGDLIIDSGIAFKLDKQISAYTQTGGILALKTSTLDSKIKSSETKISKLESQMDAKEADLRAKYGVMEGSLNSLEAQQNTISNFTRQNNKN